MSQKGSPAIWKVSSGIVGLLVLLAMLVAANIVIGSLRLRKDFTAERLFTLSDGTRKIMGKLDQKVTLKLFFNSSSPSVPVYLKNYAKQVEDLLAEYKVAGGRKVTVEKYDPSPDSDAEEWAQKYGLSGQQVDLTGPALYLGLVAVSGDSEAVLPVLDPRQQELLEYNITRLIYRVVHAKKPVIGVLSSLPVLGNGEMPPFSMPGQPRPPNQPAWASFRELQQDFDVRTVATDVDSIGADIDALIVVHPKDLPEKTLYAVDQFVLRGGHVLAFVDPLCVADLESGAGNPYGMGGGRSSTLGKLFAAWGVGYETDKVVADARAATRVRGPNNTVEESVVWLSLTPSQISRKDVLTSQLESLMLPYAGAFSDLAVPGLKVAPLIQSSDMSCAVNAMSAQFGGEGLRREFKAGKMPLSIAVRVTGKFKTAFPDGQPKDAPANPDDKEAPQPAETPAAPGLKEGESAVVLVADVDMLMDRFCIQEISFFGYKGAQPVNDNLNFLANATEQVAGSADLIAVRSRGTFSRPFDRVLALAQQAREEWQAREDELVTKLRGAQQQLAEMQEGKKETSQRYILSPEQKRAIAQFREEELRIKDELKQVRKSLRRDIENLGTKVKVVNIALMPLAVVIAGVSYGVYRRRRK